MRRSGWILGTLIFGCTPLGPAGWGIAIGSAAAATLGNAVLTRLLNPTPSETGGPGAVS